MARIVLLSKVFFALSFVLSMPSTVSAQSSVGTKRVLLYDAHTSKLSAPTLARMSVENRSARPAFVQAYVRLSDNADIRRLNRQYGAKFNVNMGNVHTAVIPREYWNAFVADEAVTYVDMGNEVHCMMDSVQVLTHAVEVKKGNGGLTSSFQGEGVLIGIVDNGFDFTHPAFADENGNCRIECVWDQSAMQGGGSDYGYGSVYDTPEAIQNVRHDQSADTHGTHVLGIAGGSPCLQLEGVAPKAKLVVVSTNKSEQGIIDGVDFLLKYAESVNKPISINVSLGTILGQKDGTGNFALMLDQLLSDKKGQLLSIAAGNEGHRFSVIQDKAPSKAFLQIPAYGRDNLFFQGEQGHTYQMTITLKDTVSQQVLLEETLVSGKVETFSRTKFGTDDKEHSSLHASSQIQEKTGAPYFNLNLSYSKKQTEAWIVSVNSTDGKYLVASDYGEFTSNGKDDYKDGSREGTIASTATGKNPVTVGAYVSRKEYADLSGKSHVMEWTNGELYPLSGKGVTFDNRIKPDIVAPGAVVISSLNSFAAPYAVPASMKVKKSEYNGRTYYWGISSGTSMATPAVTGILALWLQAIPTLDLAKAKEALHATAIHDNYTGDQPNGYYGYGKVDALAGLKYLLDKENGIHQVEMDSCPIFYEGSSQRILLLQPTTIRVYALDGRQVLHTFGCELGVESLPAGIYIVRANGHSLKIVKTAR